MPIQIPVTQVGLEASIQAAAQSAGRNLKIDLGSASKSIGSLSQPLGRITGQADDFTKSMEAANARVLAFGASVGVLAAVTKGFKEMIGVTIQVEKSLADINGILGASSSQLNKFKNDIFSIAKDTGNSFATVSEAALELSRQGLKTDEVLIRLKDSMILSRLSGLDAASSVEGLTAAVNSFSKTGVTTSEVLNKLSNTAAKFAVSERDLIQGFQRSASVAQQAGVSLDELGGIITAVQQKTARGGAVIGNAFKTIFTRIQRPESLAALQDIGAAVTDAQGGILPATKLIENLAEKINGLNDIQRANITEKIGGGFQIGPLLAALDDLTSKTSIYKGATEAMASAGSEAYGRNTALNQTLAAAINSTTVSMQQLANTLGELGVTDNLKNLLSYFSSFTASVQNLLEGDTLGSDFAKGIVKGIGGVLSGPGLLIFGAIIAKLTFNFIKFGNEALKTFFNIGNSAKELNAVQGTIVSTLLNNKNIQSQILALEGNRVAQAKFFSTALNTQLATMEKMRSIAASIAPAVVAGTSVRSRRAADGYMPSVMAESSDIKRGVGGAKSSDKPVVIPNFNLGGGKKGTMVANSGEYLVPNFGGGSGSAIFNREMVGRMGLPSNAQKINSAGGFVPNFVDYSTYSSSRLNQLVGGKRFQERIASNSLSKDEQRILAASQEKKSSSSVLNLDSASVLNIDANRLGGLGVVSVSGGTNAPVNTSESRAGMSASEIKFLDDNFGKNKINTVSISNIQSKSLGNLDASLKKDNQSAFRDKVKQKFSAPLVDLGKELIGKTFEGNDRANYLSELSAEKNDPALFSDSVLGGIFESAIRVATKSVKKIGAFKDVDANSPFDFEEGGRATTAFKKAFKFEGDLFKADAKKTANTKTIRTIVGKSLRDAGVGGKIKLNYGRKVSSKIAAKGANGYIPNFADALKEAISREVGAGVDPSQVYVDQSSSLKNTANPMGLMVANRRDEPQGGWQGIARARKEGANAQTYGAADGFVPNFASENLLEGLGGNTRNEALAAAQKQYVQSLSALTKSYNAEVLTLAKIESESLKKQNAIRQELSAIAKDKNNRDASGNITKEASAKMKALTVEIAQEIQTVKASNIARKDLTAAQQVAKAEAKTRLGSQQGQINTATTGSFGRQTRISNASAAGGAGGPRDMLGTIFAVQAGLSALQGATSGAESKVGQFTSALSSTISTLVTLMFVSSGLKTALAGSTSGIGMFASKALTSLAPIAIGAAAVVGGIRLVSDSFKIMNGDFDASRKAIAGFSDKLDKFELPKYTLPQTKEEKISQDISSAGVIKDAEFDFYKSKGFNFTGAGLDKISGDSLSGNKDLVTIVNALKDTKLISDQEIKELITVAKSSSGNNAEQAIKYLADSAQTKINTSNLITESFAAFSENGLKGASEKFAGLEGLRSTGDTKKDQQLLISKLSESLSIPESQVKNYAKILDDYKEINKEKQAAELSTNIQASGEKVLLEIMKKRLDISLQLRDVFYQMPSNSENQLSIEKELNSTLESRKIQIDNQLEANKRVRDVVSEQVKNVSSTLTDKAFEGQAFGSLDPTGKLYAEEYAKVNNIISSITSQIEKQGGWNEQIKNDLDTQLKTLKKQDKSAAIQDEYRSKIVASLSEEQMGLAKIMSAKNMIADIDQKRLAIAKATNFIQEQANKNSISFLSNRNSELDIESKIAKARLDLKKSQIEGGTIGGSNSAKAGSQAQIIKAEQALVIEELKRSSEKIANDLQKSLLEKAFEIKLSSGAIDQFKKDFEKVKVEILADGRVDPKETKELEVVTNGFANQIEEARKAEAIAALKASFDEKQAKLEDRLDTYKTAQDFNSKIIDSAVQFKKTIESVILDKKDAAAAIEPAPAIEPFVPYGPLEQEFAEDLFAQGKIYDRNAAAEDRPYDLLPTDDSLIRQERKREEIKPFDFTNKPYAIKFPAPSDSELATTYLNAERAKLESRIKAIENGGAAFADSADAAGKFKVVALESDTALQNASNSLSQLGADAVTFSNLVANAFKNLREEAAQNQFSLLSATSADSLISGGMDRLSNMSLQGGPPTEDTIKDTANNIALFSKRLDYETAIDSATKSRLKFEYEQTLKILALKEELLRASGPEETEAILRKIKDVSQTREGVASRLSSVFSPTSEENKRGWEDSLVSSSEKFRDNMIDGMAQAIENGDTLGDVLRSSALEFVREMTKANIKSAIGGVTGGLGGGLKSIFGFASGGKITGGSGSKDDVPAMLMGGEYVINKKSVSKYGSTFMESLNNGTLKGFAEGGSVIRDRGFNSGVISNTDPGFQTGRGGFQIPGYFGQGTISGKENLLSFAAQSYTSGEKDIMSSGDDAAYIDLEGESVNLTNFGRRNGPMAEAIRESKGQAFDLYLQQLAEEKRIKEEAKARKKALKDSIKMSLITIALSAVGGAAAKGFQAGAAGAAANGAGSFGQLGGGLKGVFTGGSVGGGVQVGGLKNLFTGNYRLSQIGTSSELGSYLNANPSSEFTKQFKLDNPGSFSGGKLIERALPLGSNYSLFNNSSLGLPDNMPSIGDPLGSGSNSGIINVPAYGPFDSNGDYNEDWADKKYATGGQIPAAGGIDTVPAMLSGGEFIMNAAATQRIGPSNLNSMNSGSSNTDSKDLNDRLISKLDELITASKESGKGVTINVTSDGKGNTQESQSGQESSSQDANLAGKIKAAVVSVLQQEKRLGGVLRRN